MRIGIDARFYREQGIGRYIRNLIVELQKIDQKNEYYIFLLPQDFENLPLAENFHKVLADMKWYGFKEQLKFPPLLNKYNLDLVHFPHFNIPILYRGKFVVTIHDLIHHDFKMINSSTRNPIIYEVKHQVLKRVTKQALGKSQKILTPSSFVKSELVKRWHVKDTKIVVTYEAAEENLGKLAGKLNPIAAAKILDKYSIKSPFLLYIGNAHPHKNVAGLIKTFLELRKNYQYLQLVLVAGNNLVFWEKIRQDYPQKDIIYTNFVPDEDLAAFYKCAKAYILPSFSEGFGLQLLEAMSCGCPVISSDRTSLPEVGGEAALYFDPSNQSDMVEKISRVLNDEKLRKKLMENGIKRYKQFSWEKMAKQTLEVYQKAQ